tara:strand:- start:72 stop:416 length:345 start_codon:yes stop_codon:yes gene_type:complete
LSDIEEFQKRRDALMRWTPNKSDDDPIEAVDLMGYILTASELMNDLLAEVKRLHSLDDLLRSMQEDGIGALVYDHQLAEVKRLREQLGRYTQFVLWVEEEHNEVFDEYEGKDEL